MAVLAAELAVDTSIEAILVAEERTDEFFVDTSIEAILVAEERVDEFSVDLLIEAIYIAAERLTKKLRDPSSNPVRIKTYNCLETERI